MKDTVVKISLEQDAAAIEALCSLWVFSCRRYFVAPT
jgi:hypothetical protein